MCKILWVDNDAANLQPYAEHLSQFGLDIQLEESPDKALKSLLANDHGYQCLLLDIKFYRANSYPDDESAIISGFDFLDRMQEHDIRIPVCILSSFLHIKENEERLTDYTKSSNLRGMVLDKYIADVDSDLFKVSFVDPLVLFVQEVEGEKLSLGIRPYSHAQPKQSPFRVSYQKFLGMNKAQQAELRKEARKAVAHQLADLRESEGAVWALYIGERRKAYRTAPSVDEIPEMAEVQSLAIERDRIPFQFRTGTVIEDRWGHCGSSLEQASYAKIALSAKGEFRDGDWRVHFDSGSYESYFSLEEFLELGLFTDPALMTEDVHRGVDFSYRRERVQLRLKDPETEETIDVAARVNLVEGWSTAPFLARCARSCKSGSRFFVGSVRNCVNRPGLIGRSFLIEGGLTVEYDPVNPMLKVSTKV